MSTFFTSDMHLGHKKIVEYCKRPFKNVDHMNDILVKNWNERVKDGDIVYHLGDFCFGRKESKAQSWEYRLNGSILHFHGNHDVGSNGAKGCLVKGVMKHGGMDIYTQHEPLKAKPSRFYDLILCGHAHEKWKIKFVDYCGKQIPMVNVGVDVWNFRPVKIDEIMKFIKKEGVK